MAKPTSRAKFTRVAARNQQSPMQRQEHQRKLDKARRKMVMGKDVVRLEEVGDGINVIVDNRFVAMFPMESKAQVDHLVQSLNLTFRQIREKRSR